MSDLIRVTDRDADLVRRLEAVEGEHPLESRDNELLHHLPRGFDLEREILGWGTSRGWGLGDVSSEAIRQLLFVFGFGVRGSWLDDWSLIREGVLINVNECRKRYEWEWMFWWYCEGIHSHYCPFYTQDVLMLRGEECNNDDAFGHMFRNGGLRLLGEWMMRTSCLSEK